MRTNRNQRHALLCVLQRLHVKMFKAASIGPSAYYLLEWYEGGYELVKQVYQREFGQ